MQDYANFLIRRFIVPYFEKGCQYVHLLFDDPGRLTETPKYFEHLQRDAALEDHNCFIFFDDTEVPGSWHKVLKCRACKRSLTLYISDFILNSLLHMSEEDEVIRIER